jgi:flagellar basal body rod protein FlgG
MIDANMSDALGRIAARAQDVLHAYQGGFEPAAHDATLAGKAAFEASLDPLSVVAPEGTYFVVGGAAGRPPSYSRDGSFTFTDGTLRASDGSVVLGTGTRGAQLGPLTIDPVDRALGQVSDERIEADGSVCYTRISVDPRTGARRTDRISVGRLALARFPAGTLPVRLDATHLAAPRGVTPHLGAPADGNFAMLTTHARDLGRLDLVAGLARLQEAYLSFEAIRAAGSAHGSVAKTTMDLVK